MGLYKLITEKYLNFRKDASGFQGLLEHAEHILRSARFSCNTDAPFLFFDSFVEELGFSKMGILLTDENQFKIYFSYGFSIKFFSNCLKSQKC